MIHYFEGLFLQGCKLCVEVGMFHQVHLLCLCLHLEPKVVYKIDEISKLQLCVCYQFFLFIKGIKNVDGLREREVKIKG